VASIPYRLQRFDPVSGRANGPAFDPKNPAVLPTPEDLLKGKMPDLTDNGFGSPYGTPATISRMLSPEALVEARTKIPLSPKTKAIASDPDGKIYIVGAEIPPKHIGASKHDEVFGPEVVVRITKPFLDSIKDIIQTQDPIYELKAGDNVLKSADANASHAEVQAVVGYLQRHPQFQGRPIEVTVTQEPCDYSCKRGVLQILSDYYQSEIIVH
jgi:hypothetical protein